MIAIAFLLSPKTILAHKLHAKLLLITFTLQREFRDNVKMEYRPMSLNVLLLMTAESQPDEFR
jgi:hypothetical protein